MAAPSGAGSGSDRLRKAAQDKLKQKAAQVAKQQAMQVAKATAGKAAQAIPVAGQAITAAKVAHKVGKTGVELGKQAHKDITGDDKHLGAGGTSASDGRIQDEQRESANRARKTAVAAGAGAAAAPAAAKLAALLAFLNWLKTMAAAAWAALLNALSAFLAWLAAVVKTAVTIAITLGTAVASLLGGAITAVTGAVMVITTVVALIGGAIAAVSQAQQANELVRHDQLIEDCAPVVDEAVLAANAAGNAGNVSAATEDNAKKVYSILKAWGATDTAIAGLLGNWTHESAIDSTGIETIYDEPFTMGPKKQAAEADWNGFTLNTVFPKHEASFTPNYGAYVGLDGTYYPGIGLGQWTGPRAQMLLEWGKKMNQPWHSFEAQLTFLVAGDYPSRVQVFKDFIKTEYENPGQAADEFREKWEGARFAAAERIESANAWYAKMNGWEVDQDLADSILDQAGTALTTASSAAVQDAMNKCRSAEGAVGIANGDLAQAAASYAWPYVADSYRNDGTYLYVWLHDQIFPGDPYYASCDRTVATAVRWSGTDNTYPVGAVEQQLAYLTTSPKWTAVDWGGDYSQLKPGDIFIRNDGGVSHTAVWTGTEIPDQLWGVGKHDAGANMVHGSYAGDEGRSPGADVAYSGSDGINTYAVFRSTGKEASSPYTSLKPPANAGLGLGDKSRYTTPY